MSDLIALAFLSTTLLEEYGDRGPGYYRAHRLAADGLLPTVRMGNRLFVERNRLPEIARLLRILPETSETV